MAVKIRQRRGSWWIFVDFKGRRKAKRCASRRAAEEAAEKIDAKLKLGEMDVLERDQRRLPPTVPTFVEYANRWCAEAIAPHRKARTEDYYRQILSKHLLPAFGRLSLSEIKPPHVRAFIADKLNAGAARNTVKNMVATLRAILYHACQVDDLIASNPAARFGRFFDYRHDPREHVATLDEAEVAHLLRTAAKWYPDHEISVRMFFYTGAREGEVFGVQWDDIDFYRSLLDLRRTVAVRNGRLIVNTPKSGRLRTVDMPSGLCARLKELKSIRQAQAAVDGNDLSPWVFPAATDPDKPLNASWFWRHVWTPLLDKAGLRHIRIHDARHSYASMMLRRGVPIAYVCKQLGHSSIQVTVDLYGHFIPGADRHHVERLAEAIEELEPLQSATPAQPSVPADLVDYGRAGLNA